MRLPKIFTVLPHLVTPCEGLYAKLGGWFMFSSWCIKPTSKNLNQQLRTLVMIFFSMLLLTIVHSLPLWKELERPILENFLKHFLFYLIDWNEDTCGQSLWKMHGQHLQLHPQMLRSWRGNRPWWGWGYHSNSHTRGKMLVLVCVSHK